jgi:antitoxin HicB
VTCRDFPEAITQGETLVDALLEVADCLEEAIEARMDDGREIPIPTGAMLGELLVSVAISKREA